MHDPLHLEDPISVPSALVEDPTLLPEVLSLHAWHSCLSEPERANLRTHLPSGLPEEPVAPSENAVSLEHVLDGSSCLHFGNPLARLMERLASGACQPLVSLYYRAVNLLEQKAFHMRLRRFHAEKCRLLEAKHDLELERRRKRRRKR